MKRMGRRALDGALALTAAALAALIVRAGAQDPEHQAQALTQDPLNLPSLRDLGLRLDRQGRLSQADGILAFVGRRSWRDGPTEVWLLRRRLDQRRYGEALASADSLLRVDAEGRMRPVLFELLIAAADDPAGRAALVGRLAPAPWWRGDFLRALGTQGEADSARTVFAGLAIGPTPPSPDEYAPLIDRLVSTGQYEAARDAWLAVVRLPHAEAPLRDRDFTCRYDHTPFTWSVASGVGASSETGAPPGTLHVVYDGYSAPSLPAQLLVRPPARYLLSWRERIAPPTPERLYWRVRCAPTNQIIARAPPSTSGWRSVTMAVAAREGSCPAQWLELVAEPGERRGEVEAWYAGFGLRDAPVSAPLRR